MQKKGRGGVYTNYIQDGHFVLRTTADMGPRKKINNRHRLCPIIIFILCHYNLSFYHLVKKLIAEEEASRRRLSICTSWTK